MLTGVPVDQVAPIWAEAATVQPRTQAEIRQIGVAAGIPLTTILRDEGWTEEELQQLEADKDAESQRNQATLAAAMASAQQRFNAGEEAE